MPQKYCATCNQALNSSERALGEIQCSACYERWVRETLPAAAPYLQKIIDEMHADREKNKLF